MRKFLMMTSALVCLYQPAEADPVSAAVAVNTWLVAQVGATMAAAIVTTTVSLVASTALSMAFGTRQAGVRQADIIRELQQPTSLPVYRFVYGKTWAPGTPAPVRVIKNRLFACYILNSRPSIGPFTVYLDKRAVEYTGNPYDFSGPGAQATNGKLADHCQYWIGRGDQVSPPAAILAEASEYFQASDGWRGLTVLWVRLRAGDEDERMERWPAAPPEVMVDGYWSLVRDPRNPSAPAAWSANQAACVLDALQNNPLRPYDDRNLYLEMFDWAAEIADQPFAVKGGGTIPRFEVNGVLAFTDGSEIEDQIKPLVEAGASRFVRVGGRLGILPAVYSAPVMTLRETEAGSAVIFNRYRPSSELVTEVCAKYVSPQRMYEEATTPIYTLAGAQAMDGGDPKLGQFTLSYVTDHRQAQYVAAIMGRRTRMQKSLSGSFPPETFDLIGGSCVQNDFPSPYLRRNGLFEIESTNPGGDPIGINGVALRCDLVMRETAASIYAWNAAVDEQEVIEEEFDAEIPSMEILGSIAVTSNSTTALVSGDSSSARVLFTFDPSLSDMVRDYEWQYSVGGGSWQAGGFIGKNVRNTSGKVFGYLNNAVIGSTYVIRVRPRSSGGAAAEFVSSAPIVASAGAFQAGAPTPVSAVGGSGEIAVTFRSPNSGSYRYMEIWGSNSNTTVGAVKLFGPVYGSANKTETEVETGLGSAITRYYFACSFDRNGQPSPYSASINATTL